MSVLSQAHFHDEAEAFKILESIVWAGGTVCPHCGVVGGRVYDLSDVRGSKSAKNPEGAIRCGFKKWGECRKQFTVKVGTVFEHGRMPLHKMLQAVHLIVSSKKGISANQIARILEVQFKSAWFLVHRIREAMCDGDLSLFGNGGGIIEAEETFIGRICKLVRREFQQSVDPSTVCDLQRCHVSLPRFSCIDQICPPPCEARLP